MLEEDTSSTDSGDITVRSPDGIPGGLAGIKHRMMELGHYMNLPDPASHCEAGRASQNQPNSPTNSVGSCGVGLEDEDVVVFADFCNDRGQSVDAILPTRTEG
jgi:hypothetical protein